MKHTNTIRVKEEKAGDAKHFFQYTFIGAHKVITTNEPRIYVRLLGSIKNKDLETNEAK